MKNLVIVESPAKAKTIQKYLGEGFLVKSSMGHIRDLREKDLSIDVEHGYAPIYEVPAGKQALVTDLKREAEKADVVWLASDEDREGEAIAWHLAQVLKIPQEKIRRIVFHEITESAIKEAIKNPRSIDLNLVNAQQARRVLDRIVGFKASPILWKRIQPRLSAGRVQSVAVRLVVEREREIENFVEKSDYRVVGIFTKRGANGKLEKVKAELQNRFATKEEAAAFLELCKDAEFVVDGVEKKPAKRSPAAPFTTSTLQQEAAQKLGFSVAQTMRVAQKLYEDGKITYMRTDSVNLSSLAYNTAKEEIVKEMGEKYWKLRKYTTKSLGAQEAHEAIRPTYIRNKTITGTSQEQRLYDLIWKRTVASQMADAQVERTLVTIKMLNSSEHFAAVGEVLLFDGFLRVYNGGGEKDVTLPPIEKGETLTQEEIVAQERFSQKPPRYNEATLVKKMEELGIGRPSTYAPTITTIKDHKYVEQRDIANATHECTLLSLKGGKVTESVVKEKGVYEKKKLVPADTGRVVNDFLVQYFTRIMDYNFTANIEGDFDKIATGNLEWTKSIDDFYKQFMHLVENVSSTNSSTLPFGSYEKGVDPKSGRKVLAKLGPYGPIVQLGTVTDTERPRFVPLPKDESIETISLEECLKLLEVTTSYPKHSALMSNMEVNTIRYLKENLWM